VCAQLDAQICTWNIDCLYCRALVMRHFLCLSHKQARTHVRSLSCSFSRTFAYTAYAADLVKRQSFDTATHSNALQRTATHCNALQHTATHCNTQRLCCRAREEAHISTLQHTTTHCNALQHTATHTAYAAELMKRHTFQHTATRCNAPQHTATHCNTHRFCCRARDEANI